MPTKRRADRAPPTALARRSSGVGGAHAGGRQRTQWNSKPTARHFWAARDTIVDAEALGAIPQRDAWARFWIRSSACAAAKLWSRAGRLELSFVTMAASSREELLRLMAKYRRPESAARVLDLAWTHAQLEFRHLQIGAEAAHSYQQLAGYLIFPIIAAAQSHGSRPVPSACGQRDLWALGISGDLPIVTVTVREQTRAQTDPRGACRLTPTGECADSWPTW